MRVVEGFRFLNLATTILDAAKYCVASLPLASQNSRSCDSGRNLGKALLMLVSLLTDLPFYAMLAPG